MVISVECISHHVDRNINTCRLKWKPWQRFEGMIILRLHLYNHLLSVISRVVISFFFYFNKKKELELKITCHLNPTSQGRMWPCQKKIGVIFPVKVMFSLSTFIIHSKKTPPQLRLLIYKLYSLYFSILDKYYTNSTLTIYMLYLYGTARYSC